MARSYPFLTAWTLGLLFAIAGGSCARTEGKVPTLQLATWFGSAEAREAAEIVAKVNRRHEGEFVVKMLTIPGDYLTKVDTMMAGKLAPDLFLLSQEYIPSYAKIGAIADLDARIKADKAIDLPDYYAQGLETARFEGHLYGLPWVMNPVVMYYNKTLFDAAKLAYPDNRWTWTTFQAAARRLTRRDKEGQYSQWGFLQYTWPPFSIWVWQNGGEVLNADRTAPTFDDPRTIEALDFMHPLINQDHVSPGAGTVAAMGQDELFKSGQIGMFFGGGTDDKDRTPGLAVGMAELPKGRQRATFCWMADLVISNQSKHPDLAYVAWREILDGLHHWKIVPPRRSLARQLAQIDPRKKDAKAVILASLEYARGSRGVVEQTDWETIVFDKLLNPIVSGGKSAPDAAAATQAKLEKLLELSR